MQWLTCKDLAAAELAAAERIALGLVQAIEERGRATLAISGGNSPWGMFAQLAERDVRWDAVHIFQVDERIVPRDHESRNWRRFLENPLARRIPAGNHNAMPVEAGKFETDSFETANLELAVGRYSATLAAAAGVPPMLDVVQLGIGEDGHTASLFADDALLEDRRHWVGVSRRYQGHRRLTLTLPVLNTARSVVWFAVGAGRRDILSRLRAADPAIPASHVRRDRAVCFMDADAAPET